MIPGMDVNMKLELQIVIVLVVCVAVTMGLAGAIMNWQERRAIHFDEYENKTVNCVVVRSGGQVSISCVGKGP